MEPICKSLKWSSLLVIPEILKLMKWNLWYHYEKLWKNNSVFLWFEQFYWITDKSQSGNFNYFSAPLILHNIFQKSDFSSVSDFLAFNSSGHFDKVSHSWNIFSVINYRKTKILNFSETVASYLNFYSTWRSVE